MIVPHRLLLPGVLLAAVLAAGACGGAQDDAEPAGVSSTGDAVAEEAAAPPLPPPGTPWTAEDSLRAIVEDSLYELRNLTARQASMATYEECMESAKGLEQPQRRTIEAACGRTRGNSPP